jgi:hypothetical protein
MNKISNKSFRSELNRQSAINLLAATFNFLKKNNVPKEMITDFTKRYHASTQSPVKSRHYAELQNTHEEMGVIMGTWFTNPRFLDPSGNPIPLKKGNGPASLSQLIRVSRARIEPSTALELMRNSPSIRVDTDGKINALRRVFVLPELEVPRAAFVIERFLNTLQQNAKSRKKDATLLLERSCHVSEVDLSVIAPLLRDIEERGTAFMDSIDGEIEEQRLRREKQRPTGEMGVLVFAWTKASKKRNQVKRPQRK